ncbi:mTERF domain-containing protein [Cephalotus follicularis]|uniref:mTERF domain-containing protein n=1 Tax=Cephalotus follicularis TaxID=3775 RepID=A0A1Q3D097_CEPFO|nr:mTERF domain-containing protein [Cephalotus follicularis]
MMRISLCKAKSHLSCTYNLCSLINPSIVSLRYFSSNANEYSFTVSYLINSCGLSPESALSASKYVHFETPDKPNSVIDLFKNHGFSKSQISLIAKRHPPLLSSTDPERFLLRKIEFFYSKGMSKIDLAKIVSSYPVILSHSLNDRISPNFEYYEGLLGSDDLLMSIKRFPSILAYNPQSCIEPNIRLLREYGVSEPKIRYLLSRQPRTFIKRPDVFKEVVEEVKEMGVSPIRFNFIMAIHAKTTISKSTWEKKLDIYRRWGWSEEEISLAFARFPWCMMLSEDKIMAAMEIFVNKLDWDSKLIARCPSVLGLSLKKRIAPRCSVLRFLLLKGLIDRSMSIGTLFVCPEELFLRKYVVRYEEEAPHLLKLYREQMDLSN